MIKVQGINHITIAVSDLDCSLDFYTRTLGARLVHQGRTDAYIEWGTIWLCLLQCKDSKDNPSQSMGVDHVAFTVLEEEFDEAVAVLMESNVTVVRGPIERGGGKCINFLDPDGTQLELNTGSLDVRMKVWV